MNEEPPVQHIRAIPALQRAQLKLSDRTLSLSARPPDQPSPRCAVDPSPTGRRTASVLGMLRPGPLRVSSSLTSLEVRRRVDVKAQPTPMCSA